MLECIVLGDSIASGVGQARPECETVARVGITSGTYINDLFPLAHHTARTAVISLGVNDDTSADTIDNLRQVRAALSVGSAVWLLPGLKENVRAAIRTVAGEYGDQLVDTRPYVGPDHLHPGGAGYRTIAAQTAGSSPGLAPGGDTEVAFAPVPLPPAMAGKGRREGPPALNMGGNLARYRLHVVFQGKLQQMADLRLQLAHQQAGHGSSYARWPAADTTYGALPPPSLAYGAFPTPLPAGSTAVGTNGGTGRSRLVITR